MSIDPAVCARLRQHLESVYGSVTTAAIWTDLSRLLDRYHGTVAPRRAGWDQTDAFLITYADSILGDQPPLRVLRQFLNQRVGNLLSFVHLLPFFPYTSDDGFSVTDYRAVRDDLGSWPDIHALADEYRLVFDGVINHVSQASDYARGYLAGDPAYADFFISLDPQTDTSSVTRPRDLPLLHDYDSQTGKKWLWTTFSRDQLDLNFANPRVLLEILDVMLGYARHGASMIRIDAIPYLWKQLGTSCVHLPQTHQIVKLIRAVYDAVAPHLLVLTETNVPHQENISYFGDRGDEAQMIYNFSLAPLILWSLHRGDASVLTDWARPVGLVSDRATYLNITATHDGIGLRPTEGILSDTERLELVRRAKDHGGDVSRKRNADGSVSPYELNVNYFDAVNDPRADDPLDLQVRRFMLTQSIPLAFVGLPAIYLHSLLGSRNDHDGVRRTGRARSINREQLRADDLATDLDDPSSRRARVFDRYRHLLGLRRQQAAFHPNAEQEVLDIDPAIFALKRTNNRTGDTIYAVHHFGSGAITCRLRLDPGGSLSDLLAPADRIDPANVILAPYQVRWLKLSGAD